MCPECGSPEVTVHEYDYGICRETGYHDAGERYRCHACGSTGDADDLVVPRPHDIDPMGPSFAAPAAGGKVAQFR